MKQQLNSSSMGYWGFNTDPQAPTVLCQSDLHIDHPCKHWPWQLLTQPLLPANGGWIGGAFCLRDANLSHDSGRRLMWELLEDAVERVPLLSNVAVSAAWWCTMICLTFAFNLLNSVLVRKHTEMILNQNCKHFWTKGQKGQVGNCLEHHFRLLLHALAYAAYLVCWEQDFLPQSFSERISNLASCIQPRSLSKDFLAMLFRRIKSI